MVYDRTIDSKILTFEASGALRKASLVMRDRETDSWWSIMSSSAIGGELTGADLDELPVGEKTTWADWAERYPDSLVLSVEGEEHVAVNRYDEYFASPDAFRNMKISDQRLAPKTPIFGFWLDGRSFAIRHDDFEGGRVFELPATSGKTVFLYRGDGASMFATTSAWTLDDPTTSLAELLSKLRASAAAGSTGTSLPGTPLDGIDTFWYNWISVNTESVLLP